MKTNRSLLALVGAVLSLSTASLIAGPGPQFWNRATPVTTTKEADALKPSDTAVMVCGACKTVLVRDSRHVGPAGNILLTGSFSRTVSVKTGAGTFTLTSAAGTDILVTKLVSILDG